MAGAGQSVLNVLNEDENKGIDTCSTCPRLCRWACPVAEAESRETSSPYSLVVLSGLLKRDRASLQTVGTAPYHCSHCGACTQACLHKNDVPMLLSMARARLLAGGGALPQVRELCGRFGMVGNPQGVSLAGALETVAERAGASIGRSAKVVYVPGCSTLEKLPDASAAFLRAVSLLGISGISVVRDSAACCGLPLYWAGELEGFRAHAQRYAKQFAQTDELVVHEPSCAHALSERYASVGVQLRPKIKTIVQFLLENVDLRSSRKVESSGRVAYADTCTLTRSFGQVEEPRGLIARLLTDSPVEISGDGGLTGAEVDCCGAGGLLPLTAPATATAMAEAKIQAFQNSGAEELAMFSPRCVSHLKSVRPSLNVIDGAMLMARL